MPYNPNLDIAIDETQRDAILTDINTAMNTLAAIGEVFIDPSEVNELNVVNNIRLPYVQRAVEEFSTNYPSLVSGRITAARAGNLLDSIIALRNIESRLNEFTDRVKDLNYNVGNILYNYTTDMYHNAQRYQGDVEGADIVEDYLKELFEGQGPQNETAD